MEYNLDNKKKVTEIFGYINFEDFILFLNFMYMKVSPIIIDKLTR